MKYVKAREALPSIDEGIVVVNGRFFFDNKDIKEEIRYKYNLDYVYDGLGALTQQHIDRNPCYLDFTMVYNLNGTNYLTSAIIKFFSSNKWRIGPPIDHKKNREELCAHIYRYGIGDIFSKKLEVSLENIYEWASIKEKEQQLCLCKKFENALDAFSKPKTE